MIKTLRWIVSSLLILIFLVVIIVGTPMVLFSQYITNPQNIKDLVSDSTLYNKAPDFFVDIMKDKASADPFLQDILNNISDPDSESREIFDKVFSEAKLAELANSSIDQTYNFLSGKSPDLEINLQLVESKDDLINIFIDTYRIKSASLPVCTDTSVEITAKNIYEQNCVPSGFSFDEFELEFRNMVETSSDLPLQDILDSTTVNTGKLLSSNDASRVQLIFSIINQFLIGYILAIIVIGLLLILMVPGFRVGVIVTGIVTFLGGSVLFILGTLAPYKIVRIVEVVGLEGFGFVGKLLPYIQSVLNSLLTWFYGQFSTWGVYYMIAGVVLTGIAVLTSFLGKGNGKKSPKPGATNDNSQTVLPSGPTFEKEPTSVNTEKDITEATDNSLLDDWKKASDAKLKSEDSLANVVGTESTDTITTTQTTTDSTNPVSQPVDTSTVIESEPTESITPTGQGVVTATNPQDSK
ncbi:hypothetical protein JW962_01005 [Candidatus Dojkabacteria bacterium]|nr:hypothetical protein [Candidatus Dojkabacteria bacterium]